MTEDSKKQPEHEEDESSILEEKVIHVDPGQASLRVDKFIFDRLQGISRNRIQMAIKNKAGGGADPHAHHGHSH